MTMTCPRCRTEFIVKRPKVQRVSTATGGVIGAIRGASTALASGTASDGGRTKIDLITAAVVGGLLGGAAGCAAGSAIGETVEQTILNNYRCKACGYVFGQAQG